LRLGFIKRLLEKIIGSNRFKWGSDGPMDPTTVYNLGVAFIFISIAALLIAFLLFLISSFREKGKMRSGGAIIIGFVPIVFGTDKESIKKILLLSLLLTIVLAVVTILCNLVFR
jgi:uncharacterized membrane protein